MFLTLQTFCTWLCVCKAEKNVLLKIYDLRVYGVHKQGIFSITFFWGGGAYCSLLPGEVKNKHSSLFKLYAITTYALNISERIID